MIARPPLPWPPRLRYVRPTMKPSSLLSVPRVVPIPDPPATNQVHPSPPAPPERNIHRWVVPSIATLLLSSCLPYTNDHLTTAATLASREGHPCAPAVGMMFDGEGDAGALDEGWQWKMFADESVDMAARNFISPTEAWPPVGRPFVLSRGGAQGSKSAARMYGHVIVGGQPVIYSGPFNRPVALGKFVKMTLAPAWTQAPGVIPEHATVPVAFDARSFGGVSFWARNDGKYARDVSVSLWFDDYFRSTGITLSKEWKQYTILFKDILMPEEERAKNFGAVTGLTFEVSSGQFDLWIDDVQFTGCVDAEGPPMREQIVRQLRRDAEWHLSRHRSVWTMMMDNEILSRFDHAPQGPLMELIAEAMVSKGHLLEASAEPDAALSTYDSVISRFTQATDPQIRTLVQTATADAGRLRHPH